MLRVVHFEINADDPERVVKFYQKVFGWKIEKWNGRIRRQALTTLWTSHQ